MESHVRIHTNWDGMIDRLESGDSDSLDGMQKESCSSSKKPSSIVYTEPGYAGLLRYIALILAGVGIIGIVVNRSPYVAQKWHFIKMFNVHVYLGCVAVSMLLYLLIIILKRKVEEAKEQ